MRRDRRAFSSRANAQKSTGPRTPAGKATVARNAHRHGLSLPVLDDPALSREVEDVARAIAKPLIGAEPQGRQRELACRMAEPIIDLRRVREAKLPLVAALQADPKNSAALKQLVQLDRYERRALWRRTLAIREFCTASLAPGHPDAANPVASAQNKANWDNSSELRHIMHPSAPSPSQCSPPVQCGIGTCAAP